MAESNMVENPYIGYYGGRDAKEIGVPISSDAFVEKKRHWLFRKTITEFEIVHETLAEFHEYMLKGGYSCYIEEYKVGGLFSEKELRYNLVYKK